MIEKGSLVQLNNDHHVSPGVGQIIIQAGTEGEVETPGETRARVRFTDTISTIVPTQLLNELKPSVDAREMLRPPYTFDTLEEIAEKFLRMQIEPHLVTSARVASLAALLQGTRTHCTLENCGHMRQLDAIVDLLGMPRGGISVLDELRKRNALWENVDFWEDVHDEWTESIRAAFPTRSDSHDEYGVAMQMVGHRHSKSELVALVNWLLLERKITVSGTKP